MEYLCKWRKRRRMDVRLEHVSNRMCSLCCRITYTHTYTWHLNLNHVDVYYLLCLSTNVRSPSQLFFFIYRWASRFLTYVRRDLSPCQDFFFYRKGIKEDIKGAPLLHLTSSKASATVNFFFFFLHIKHLHDPSYYQKVQEE